jgi:TonB family protein
MNNEANKESTKKNAKRVVIILLVLAFIGLSVLVYLYIGAREEKDNPLKVNKDHEQPENQKSSTIKKSATIKRKVLKIPIKELTEEKRPAIIKKNPLIYPPEAIKANIQGDVILKLTVNIYGEVEEIEVIEGNTLLSESAIISVKSWIYDILIENEQPMRQRFPQRIRYSIKGNIHQAFPLLYSQYEEYEKYIQREIREAVVVPNERALKIIHYVDPQFPSIAHRTSFIKKVVAEIIVTRKGTVAQVKIISGHPLLRMGAVFAAKRWIFMPYVENGIEKPAKIIIVISFPKPDVMLPVI